MAKVPLTATAYSIQTAIEAADPTGTVYLEQVPGDAKRPFYFLDRMRVLPYGAEHDENHIIWASIQVYSSTWKEANDMTQRVLSAIVGKYLEVGGRYEADRAVLELSEVYPDPTSEAVTVYRGSIEVTIPVEWPS